MSLLTARVESLICSCFHGLLAAAVLFLFSAGLTAQTADDLSALSTKIFSGTVEEKRDALYRIRNLKDPAASEIALPALGDKSAIVRATAAHSVVFLPPRRAGEALAPLLEDESAFVRQEAAYALGETGDSGSAELLARSLEKDGDRKVRAAVAASLGKIGTAGQVELLVEILRKKPRKADEFLRRSAARSIGQIAQFVQTQQRQLSTPTDFLPDNYLSAGGRRYERLAEAFPVFRTANEVLARSLKNDKEFPNVKRDAAFALGAIGDASSAVVLAACSNSPDYYLAEICRKALASSGAK